MISPSTPSFTSERPAPPAAAATRRFSSRRAPRPVCRGADRPVGQSRIETAHQICPYPQASRGNLDVEITLV